MMHSVYKEMILNILAPHSISSGSHVKTLEQQIIVYLKSSVVRTFICTAEGLSMKSSDWAPNAKILESFVLD